MDHPSLGKTTYAFYPPTACMAPLKPYEDRTVPSRGNTRAIINCFATSKTRNLDTVEEPEIIKSDPCHEKEENTKQKKLDIFS